MRDNSIQILVELVVAELHIDKPLPEKKKKKKKGKNQPNKPKAFELPYHLLFISPDVDFPFPSNLS